MSLFEQQLYIINEFDNCNYNTYVYKEFLNNSKNEIDYNRNYSLIFDLINNRIVSSTNIEDIRKVFKLYLDLFIKNDKNIIEEQTNIKQYKEFSKIYFIKNIKTNLYIIPIHVFNNEYKINNNNEIQIGINYTYIHNSLSICVDNIEILNKLDLDNLIISTQAYDDNYKRINNILNTYIEDEKVEELKNILLNDDLNKLIKFLNKYNIISNNYKLTIRNININFCNYKYSILYNCVLLSAVKCFTYLFINNYIINFKDIAKAMVVSGNVSIFILSKRYLSKQYLDDITIRALYYHKNNLFDYIFDNYYDDEIKNNYRTLYHEAVEGCNFNQILKLANKGYVNYGICPLHEINYILVYIYDNFGISTANDKTWDNILYELIYEDYTVKEYMELLYRLPISPRLDMNRIIFNCFKYNKSVEFIKELINEFDITAKTCKYIKQPLNLLIDLIKLNNRVNIETFEKVFSNNKQTFNAHLYFYNVKNIIFQCFKHKIPEEEIKNIIKYLKQGGNLTETEINDMKPVRTLYYINGNAPYEDKIGYEKYGNIMFNNINIYYNNDDMRLFSSMLRRSCKNPYTKLINNSNKPNKELLKLYKKYISCLTIKE